MLKLRQIQLIVDKLMDQELVQVRPRDLDEPWRTIHRRVQPLDDLSQAEHELWRATEGLAERALLLESLLEALPEPDACRPFASLQDLAADLPPVDWLWPAWIPRGMLSLLGASPGAGKSLVALDLARRIIHGQPFPDGSAVRRPGANVLYVDAEAIPQLQRQRAVDWGLDCSRLYLMLPPGSYDLLDLGVREQQDTLIHMVHDLRPELVIVDSLSSISLKGENSVEDVRAILRFLSAVAREFDVGLLLIHHLRKRLRPARPTPNAPLEPVSAEDMRGSGHIIAMSRSVLALSVVQAGPRFDRNGPRRLEVVKANLCAYPPPLGLRFVTAAPGPEAGTAGKTPLLRYGDPPAAGGVPSQLEACMDWLGDHLAEAGGPLRPREVITAAQEAGFGRATLYRARKELDNCIVETGSSSRDPNKTWVLAAAGDGDDAGHPGAR